MLFRSGGGGGNNLSSLVGALASFAGMQPGIMKTLLTYLAPIVLGMIAKQFTGRPDAAGVSRLFSEQAANIRGAMPRGFSLPYPPRGESHLSDQDGHPRRDCCSALGRARCLGGRDLAPSRAGGQFLSSGR